jgi:hypothetical protein
MPAAILVSLSLVAATGVAGAVGSALMAFGWQPWAEPVSSGSVRLASAAPGAVAAGPSAERPGAKPARAVAPAVAAAGARKRPAVHAHARRRTVTRHISSRGGAKLATKTATAARPVAAAAPAPGAAAAPVAAAAAPAQPVLAPVSSAPVPSAPASRTSAPSGDAPRSGHAAHDKPSHHHAWEEGARESTPEQGRSAPVAPQQTTGSSDDGRRGPGRGPKDHGHGPPAAVPGPQAAPAPPAPAVPDQGHHGDHGHGHDGGRGD